MRKLMNKKLNKKGFTLMEMLIVVAIIAILVAIAIPTFTSALNKAKVSADEANLRALYAETVIKALDTTDGVMTAPTFGTDNNTFTVAGATYKLQAPSATAAATVAADGTKLVITYTYKEGATTKTVTIPGGATT